jgi:hypothetical protein
LAGSFLRPGTYTLGIQPAQEPIIMFRKILLYCGIAAPILYGVTVIVGAAMRNHYSHIVNAISELISNGAPTD